VIDQRRNSRFSLAYLADPTPAKIAAGGRTTEVDCTIENISIRGARLCIADPATVPDEFVLVFEAGRARRPCRVAWRADTTIGVAF
jgi:hypothetical protein